MLDLYEEFSRVVGALEGAGIPYALCGGLAVSVHAAPRATEDIDLLIQEGRVEDVKRVLAPLGYEERSLPMRLGDGTLGIRRLSKLEEGGEDTLLVDLLLASGPVPEEAWRTRERLPWGAGQVSVVSRAGLIALKRLRGSKQDQADIAALEGGA